jgi:dCMP deaminase
MIIGICGTLSSGKSTIAKILVEKGFKHFSVRDFLVQEITRKGIRVTRDNMVEIANELRAKYGPSYVVEKLYEQGKLVGGNIIIESIRNIGEVESLKIKEDFFLLGVTASSELRYKRVIKRGGIIDSISYEKFVEEEAREMNNPDPHKQNISKCFDRSDYVIDNEGDLDILKDRVGNILEDIRVAKAVEIENANKNVIAGKPDSDHGHVRPSWDEYFMNIAKVTGTRGSCDRGRAGTVIVKDKHILVGGYVGSPKGLPHCDEIGHLMKTVIHEDGSESRHCLRTAHSEQNAICQAAKLGIAIDGATIYTKMTPCAACAKMIINVGIKKVICAKRYHAGSETEKLFEKANIKLEILDEGVQQYADQ